MAINIVKPRLRLLRNPRWSQRGIGMLEVLVALALVGLAAASFLSSITTVSRSTIIADERSTADSLAISQMEYVLSQSYDDTNNPPEYSLLASVPEGWSVDATAARLDPEEDGTDNDDGIQEIEVTVERDGRQIMAVTSRKVNIAYVP